jgi:hypothetical protein
MKKMFAAWASLAALIVAAPIGKAHATDTPKFADILDSNFESAKGRADFPARTMGAARLSRLRCALTTPDGTSSSSTMARRSASGALKDRRRQHTLPTLPDHR